MISNTPAVTNLVDNLLQSVGFQVSVDMVKRFADLTGDFSSLHVDKAFGRRSGYRNNIIHGMIPVIFLTALPVTSRNRIRYLLQKVSARFLKPVFANDRLSLKVTSAELDKDQSRIELGYVLNNAKSGSTVTTGFATFYYSINPLDAVEPQPSGQPENSNCIILDALAEQDLQFKDIHKGDEQRFTFRLSKDHAHSLYEILADGHSSTFQFGFLEWMDRFDPANLLASCLFSTFVGMRIPGKHATFMDFQATYNQQIQWNRDYVFVGKVRFSSPSTATVVENISIRTTEEADSEIIASGKINAKVNDPPIKMPSVEYLKHNQLDLQLRNKVVLITGASRGIGETTAKLFSLYGAKVAINYFCGEDDARRIVDEIVSHGGQALAVQADVSDREQVKQMVEAACAEYGTVDVLVNNAVSNAYALDFLELSWDTLQKDIDIIIKGAFNCCQEIVPLMIGQKGGKIINISTIYADAPPAGQAKYVIAKSGLVGLTRSLAVEFASDNIQVNMVVPSIVETDLSKQVPKMFLEGMKNNTPMQRHASPIDVAKAVVMLASSLSSFTTGQKIMVTGGQVPFL